MRLRNEIARAMHESRCGQSCQYLEDSYATYPDADAVLPVVYAWTIDVLKEQREGIAKAIEAEPIEWDGPGELSATWTTIYHLTKPEFAKIARNYNPELEKRLKG